MKKTATKHKKVAMSAGSRNVLDNKMFGGEPAFPFGHILTKMELIHAYNWYNYMLDRADAIAYMKAYFKKLDPKIYADLARTDCNQLLTSHCWAARLIDNGYRLPEGTESKIREHVLQTIWRYGATREVTNSVRGTRDKSETVIADIEDMLDSGESFSVYDYLTKNTIAKNHAEKALVFYSPILDELNAVQSTKDKALKEGYRHLTAKALKSLIASYQAIVDDCSRFLENKKVVRKPRAKKVVSVEKKIAKVQYLANFDPYQIVSKPPSAIVGAKEVWLYNAKYKHVTKLVSTEGMDIKGTTIVNIDLELSQKKTTGRQSKTVVDAILKSGKVQLRKLMEDIKGVSSEPNGRINKDVLILRTS